MKKIITLVALFFLSIHFTNGQGTTNKNRSNPASANVNKPNKENIQKVKPANKVSPREYEVKAPRDVATGQSSGKRQHGTVAVQTPQPKTKEPLTRDTTRTQASKTARKNNIRDPFNPGSGDNDTRNPFDSTKKIKAKQPATSQANYDLKNAQVSSIKPAQKQKQQTVPANQANTSKTNVQPQNRPANKINNPSGITPTTATQINTGKTSRSPGEQDSFNRKPVRKLRQ